MARTHSRSAALLAALAALAGTALLSGAVGSVAPATAEAAGAASCGVAVTPSNRNIRRGGKVLLEGESCGAAASGSATTAVQVKLRNGKRWMTVGKARTDSSGDFAVCATVRVPADTKLARLRASVGGATGTTTVRVGDKGSSGCAAPASQTDTSSASQGTGGDAYTPPTDPSPDSSCPLSQPGSTLPFTLPSSCTVVGSDTAASADPAAFWGKLDCETASRHQQIGSGGDTHSTGTGAPQGDGAFRRLTVQDGDDYYGERCELGENESYGKTTFYHEGQRRVTFISLRLGGGVNPMGSDWRTVMQMKQAQTYRNPDTSPIIEMQVREGRWILRNSWNDVWSAPAQGNTWTRFALDVTYSQDPAIGSMRMYVDLNGDGDSSDANESSPELQMATLRAETAGSGSSRYEVGESIPDHLRAGIYQNPNYSCPTGCAVDVDNVQVVRP